VNQSLRRLAVAVGVLFLALAVNANYVQVIEAKALRENPHNSLVLVREYARQRGPIVVGGKSVADSVATNDALKYLRVYPGGAEYAPATGYFSVVYGSTGIERAEDGILSGSDNRLFSLSQLINGRNPPGGAVELTINPAAQRAAWLGLRGKVGAAVALDPQTGAVLALVSSPSYNPSLLTKHDPRADIAAYRRLLSARNQPMLDRALSQTYPPGSMFKIVTLSAALSTGRYNAQTVIPAPTQLRLPQTTHYLHNFGGEVCGNGRTDTLADAFRISCNTAFAHLGLVLGGAALSRQASRFGFGTSLSIPLLAVPSVFPSNLDQPQTALSAMGQYNDRVTPLQAAMLSAAIADGGVVMRPYLVSRLLSANFSTISHTAPVRLGRAVSGRVAAEVNKLMQLVVSSGTGTAAQIPGVTVAGKTGTAQHGVGAAPDAWFTAFAPAQHPRVAVAVVVENGGSLGSEATGGAVAAPIVRSIIEAVLRS
jgi:peptidoglycan glycosyltransferase